MGASASKISPEAVLRREARLGDAVVVYDEGGNWRGVGTAWALAEQGRRVTIVTPEPFVGKELSRTAADGVVRRRLGALGVRMLAVAEAVVGMFYVTMLIARLVSLYSTEDSAVS